MMSSRHWIPMPTGWVCPAASTCAALPKTLQPLGLVGNGDLERVTSAFSDLADPEVMSRA
jgi:hypothetical protein